MTGEDSDNPFSSIIGAILAVYDWSSISLDIWNFWPLTIVSVIGNSWKEKSKKMNEKPYPKISKLRKSKFQSWSIEMCKFVWSKEEEFLYDFM
ncbi:24748_t:CDS:2, partial [Racocetra persica]